MLYEVITFTQEFIGGKEEYSGHLILKEHKVVLFKVLKFVFESDSFVKGKTCKFKHVEEVDHSHFQDIFEQILSTVGYQGLCAINYKVKDDAIKIFEINPRYGAYTHRFINEVIEYY